MSVRQTGQHKIITPDDLMYQLVYATEIAEEIEIGIGYLQPAF